jgi:hypothetical protein
MKSKLSAVFVVAACALPVPAFALTIIIDPSATMSSLSGPVLFDDFDSVVDTSIGTITGGRPQDPNHGTAPATGNFIIADDLLGSPFNVNVTFANPVAYVGFAWGTPDHTNKLDVYDGSTLLGSFSGDFAIGAGAGTFTRRYGPDHAAATEPAGALRAPHRPAPARMGPEVRTAEGG